MLRFYHRSSGLMPLSSEHLSRELRPVLCRGWLTAFPWFNHSARSEWLDQKQKWRPRFHTSEEDEALRLVYEICPQIQFGHFVANVSMLEAFEGENFVHVVDLGMTLSLAHGRQWRDLMHSLANRTGKPPKHLRIIGVGTCLECLQAIGDDLEQYAKSLRLNFEFVMVESNLETLKPKDIAVSDGEVVIINSILQLHCVVKERRGALNSVQQSLHELSPKLFILVEQDSSHNGPFLLGRFMEALHYYSATFDSLDTMLPKYETRRAKIEQFYFAEEIKNIASCEGQARIERHERVDQWCRRMSCAGFQSAPIKMITQAKQWLGKVKGFEGTQLWKRKGAWFLDGNQNPSLQLLAGHALKTWLISV